MSNHREETKDSRADCEAVITRKELAARWQCCIETIKRRERDGSLLALRLGPRIVRYRLTDVIAYEQDALTHVAQV